MGAVSRGAALLTCAALALAAGSSRPGHPGGAGTQRSAEVLIVIYRWKLKPGGEAVFREGWREMTESIYRTRGSLGSRLHRAEDGTWVAYAQWPSEEAWRRSREVGSANEAAARKMREGAEALLSEERLHVTDDLIKPAPYDSGGPPE